MLDAIRKAYEADPNFEHLRNPRTNYVPGVGSLEPKVMIVGEAPGKYENYQQTPFVGRSGVLLYKLMKQGNFTPENSYITNTVKYRPPEDRIPTASEINASRPYLLQEWRLIGRPRFVITVGTVATKAFGIPGNITLIVKRKFDKGDYIVIPMLHPSYILRNPFLEKRTMQAWYEVGMYEGLVEKW